MVQCVRLFPPFLSNNKTCPPYKAGEVSRSWQESDISGKTHTTKVNYRSGYPSKNASPDKYFDSKPGIADALDEEESIMSISAVLVQRPGGQVPACPEGDVPDDRHPHVRVGLQAERQYGDADEED